MPSQGPSSPGSAANDASIGTIAWSGPTNILASDDTYATAAISAAHLRSNFLVATNFGFSIPGGSAIVGILVEWEVSHDIFPTIGTITDNAARLVKGGVIGGTDRLNATAWDVTDAYLPHGGAADLWGDTWTPADINASTFGAALSAKIDMDSSTAQVDHCRITVTYTAGASFVGDEEGLTYTVTRGVGYGSGQ